MLKSVVSGVLTDVEDHCLQGVNDGEFIANQRGHVHGRLAAAQHRDGGNLPGRQQHRVHEPLNHNGIVFTAVACFLDPLHNAPGHLHEVLPVLNNGALRAWIVVPDHIVQQSHFRHPVDQRVGILGGFGVTRGADEVNPDFVHFLPPLLFYYFLITPISVSISLYMTSCSAKYLLKSALFM